MNRRTRHAYRRRRLLPVYGVEIMLCVAVLRQFMLGPQPFVSVVFAGCDLWHLYLVVCGGLLRFSDRPRPHQGQHARVRRPR